VTTTHENRGPRWKKNEEREKQRREQERKHVRSLGVSAGVTEVAGGLVGGALATEKHSVGAGGALDGELIEGKHTTASLGDASTSGLRDAQGAHLEFGDNEQTLIVEDSTHNNDNLALLALGLTADEAE
jgi:hypothetical protein